MMLDGTYHIDCECGSANHTLRFVRNIDDKEAYIDVLLDRPYEWKTRLSNAWKYLTGQDREYGDFGTTIFDPDQISGLDLFLSRITDVVDNPDSTFAVSNDENVAVVRVEAIDEELGPEIVLFVSMETGSWYKRVYRAVRYLTGYLSRYGQWDCFTLDVDQVAELRKQIKIYREAKQ